ncbi:MAG: type II secretion system F family protein [Woeseiaceae bacterium]
MPVYSYRAVDPSGKIFHGNVDAANERALENRLRHANQELLRCSERGRNPLARKKKVTRRDLINFCFHLEQVIRAGLPILDALADLRDTMENNGFRETISGLVSSVEGGKSLSQAMEDYPDVFDDVFVSLVMAGEETGELPQVMQKLTDSLKWQDELVAKAKSVVMYPVFVGLVVISVLLFMMLYVVPQMVEFIREMGQELPIHTLALIGLSNFLVENWFWVLAAPPALFALIKIQARRSKNFRYRVDGWKLKMWYTGPILTKIILSRFASYFALLYGSGLDVLGSLRISEDIAGNAVIKDGLQQIGASIADGKTLSAGIESTGLFPPLVIRMVSMGESTGQLDSALQNVSYFYDREVTESIDKLKAMIEPAMTVVLGAIMGWVMLSVLGPIYQTISQIGI